MELLKDILTRETNTFNLWERSIVLAYRGSISHGTYIPKEDPHHIDDKDIMGIAIPPLENYFGLSNFEQFEKMEQYWDIVIYDFKKALRLLIKSNPNIMQLLWTPEKHILLTTPYFSQLVEHRQLFVNKGIYHSYCGYAYSQLKKMEHGAFEGYMGEKRKKIVQKFGYDCYSEDTEFLTNNGWKTFSEVAENDLLGTLNPKTQELEFQESNEAFCKKYNGEMYEFENKYTNFCITKNHKVYISPLHRQKSNGFSYKYNGAITDWYLAEAATIIEAKKSHYHVLTIPKNNTKDYSVSEDYLKLLGAFVSEGTFNKYSKKFGHHRCCRISQTLNGKREFFDTMGSLPTSFGFKKYIHKHKNRPTIETIWISHNKDIINKLYLDSGHLACSKTLPNWIVFLSKKQALILLDSLMLGDGTNKKLGKVYYTCSNKLAKQVQLLAMLGEKESQCYGPYNTKHSPMYQVYISDQPSNPKTLIFSQKIKKERQRHGKQYTSIQGTNIINYSGNVVCFSVPNGILITRRKGKIAIQGNSKNAQHLIRLLRQGIEFLNTGELVVERPDREELIDIKTGKWPLEKVKDTANKLFTEMDTAYTNSKLPENPNSKAINNLSVELLFDYFRRNK